MGGLNIFDSKPLKIITTTLLVIFGISVVLAFGIVGLVLLFDKYLDAKIIFLIGVLAFSPIFVCGIHLWFLRWYYNNICQLPNQQTQESHNKELIIEMLKVLDSKAVKKFIHSSFVIIGIVIILSYCLATLLLRHNYKLAELRLRDTRITTSIIDEIDSVKILKVNVDNNKDCILIEEAITFDSIQPSEQSLVNLIKKLNANNSRIFTKNNIKPDTVNISENFKRLKTSYDSLSTIGSSAHTSDSKNKIFWINSDKLIIFSLRE